MTDQHHAFYRPVRALDLPPIDRRALLAGDADGVWIAPPGLPRHFTRAPPAFKDDPDGAGMFTNDLGPCPVIYPPAFAVGARDMRLVGYRTILAANGQFFTDDPGVDATGFPAYLDRLAQTEDHFANEQTGLCRGDGGFAFIPGDRRTERIDGPALVLSSTEPANYGSFLFRVLPKLAMFGSMPPDWPVLAHVAYRQYRELLELAGIAPARIVPHDPAVIWHIGRAVIPGLRNPEGFLDDASRGFYAALKVRIGLAGRADRRIYVSRLGLGGHGRRMLNEAALEAALANKGFDIIRPHRMTAREQIAAFANARMVVGPSGAALFNCVFCAPGTHLIDIESEPYWIHAHACLFTSCDLVWGVFEGKTTDQTVGVIHKPFTVNIPALLRRIASFG